MSMAHYDKIHWLILLQRTWMVQLFQHGISWEFTPNLTYFLILFLVFCSAVKPILLLCLFHQLIIVFVFAPPFITCTDAPFMVAIVVFYNSRAASFEYIKWLQAILALPKSMVSLQMLTVDICETYLLSFSTKSAYRALPKLFAQCDGLVRYLLIARTESSSLPLSAI